VGETSLVEGDLRGESLSFPPPPPSPPPPPPPPPPPFAGRGEIGEHLIFLTNETSGKISNKQETCLTFISPRKHLVLLKKAAPRGHLYVFSEETGKQLSLLPILKNKVRKSQQINSKFMRYCPPPTPFYVKETRKEGSLLPIAKPEQENVSYKQNDF
jgi:hypothetical protein